MIMKKRILNSQYFFSVLMLIILIVFSSLLSSSFMRIDNLATVLRQASVLLVLCIGLTAVVLTGGIDLSVGSTAGLCACICAKLITEWEIPFYGAIIISLGLIALVGIFNGFLVGVLQLPAFVATYGSNWVISGLAVIIMNGQIIYGLPDGFVQIGVGFIGPVAIPIIIAAVGVIIFYILLQFTTFGRNIYMLGFNAEAAKFSAMNTLEITMKCYILSSLMAGIGGIIMAARLNAADAAMGDVYGLQIVAAVVMGGTSLLGGVGGVLGTVLGALILTIIVNIMNLVGISANLQGFAIGIVILFMVFVDIYSRNIREAKGI